MRVAILGCGYVGLELGRQLLETGQTPIGVRRSDEGLDLIDEIGFEPVRADVMKPKTLSRIPEVDAIVFAASSGGGDAEAARAVYVDGLQTVIEHFGSRSSPPSRLIYTSSTGVYGDHDGDWVDEDTQLAPGTEKARVLARAEDVALEGSAEHGIAGTVARLGGLYGPERIRLERYLEGPVTEGWLNLVHRDDAAGAIVYLLEKDLACGETVNVVDDEPVQKWDFADWLAEAVGRDPPPKQTLADRLAGADLSDSRRHRIEAQKRCSNAKLRALGYEFTYPTFRAGYRPAIERYLETR